MKFKNKLELKGAIIGMLLGDGYIPNSGVNKLMRIKMKSAHREYFMFKKDILENVCSLKTFLGETNDRWGKVTFSDRLSTKTNPLFTQLREHMYHDGRRTVDEHVMKCLTPLGMALWYQDNGSYAKGSGYGDVILCTDAYSKTECEMMARELQKRFKHQWRVYRRVRKNKDGEKLYFYRLYLRKKDHEYFFKLIDPFVVDCMKYKLKRDDVDVKAFRGTREESIICPVCKKEFKRFKSQKGKYCSKECFKKFHRTSQRDTAKAEDIV